MKTLIKKINCIFSKKTAASNREAHRHMCLSQVKKEPGLTAAEIAVAIGLERHEPSRRLPELRKRGLVFNGGKRICTVQGTKSMTWLPIDLEPFYPSPKN